MLDPAAATQDSRRVCVTQGNEAQEQRQHYGSVCITTEKAGCVLQVMTRLGSLVFKAWVTYSKRVAHAVLLLTRVLSRSEREAFIAWRLQAHDRQNHQLQVEAMSEHLLGHVWCELRHYCIHMCMSGPLADNVKARAGASHATCRCPMMTSSVVQVARGCNTCSSLLAAGH
jgi:hypothetical protein